MSRKISQMTEATTIKSGDISVVVQDGETKQFPLDLLATKAQADEYKTGVETQLTDYEQEITNIKNQYDKELYTPTITVTNTSMVKTGQGDTVDYSASVEDGVVKSAILKGCTLVNISEINRFSISGSGKTLFTTKKLIKDNTTYTRIVYISKNTLTGVNERNCVAQLLEGGNTIFSHDIQIALNETGLICNETFNSGTTSSSKNTSAVRIFAVNTGGVLEGYEIILEGDYTDVDIPYFEGMQSVKMPVLTTTGKNLFEPCVDLPFHMIASGKNDGALVGVIPVKPNTTYTLSVKKDTTKGRFVAKMSNRLLTLQDVNSFFQQSVYNYLRDNYANGRKFEYTINNQESLTFTTLDDCHYIYVNVDKSYGSTVVNEVLVFSEMQLEESSSATSYEPYKSNILTVNEDVTLRGIGDVKDTLDCLTGEVIERIGEVVLDGSEQWRLVRTGESTFMFGCDDYIIGTSTNSSHICNIFKVITPDANGGIWDRDEESIAFKHNDTNKIRIRILKSKVSDLISFKSWLSSNPVVVQYKLTEKVHKTVVLNPSGTLASETPYMWKDGSIQLSSDGLVPGLDYAVTTSRVGVIETNMSETITNEKRIHALEVILAQSTIAAATDAVSLQSNLESTTMSTDGAQLETENTQDNFLYEMILLLIENNAHDESLFDKVCMFYLYGKLSDEQFTNIYNLLYPVNPEEE